MIRRGSLLTSRSPCGRPSLKSARSATVGGPLDQRNRPQTGQNAKECVITDRDNALRLGIPIADQGEYSSS